MKSGINVTPYIDILLVLLIIFMVIQPAVRHQLPASIPEQTGDKAVSPVPTLVLHADHRLQINGQPVTLPQLGGRLFDLLSRRSDKRIFLYAAAELPFGSIARVIDIAKGAGAGDVGLATVSG